MIFGRHDKYRGRSTYTLPLFYVCAECGGTFRCVIEDGGGFSVTCRTDDRHDGLKPLEATRLTEAATAWRDAAEEYRQLTQIANIFPEVKDYLEEKRRADRRTLFGED